MYLYFQLLNVNSIIYKIDAWRDHNAFDVGLMSSQEWLMLIYC